MASPREKFVEALKTLKRIQNKGIVAVYTTEIPGNHRSILLKNGFLIEVSKGWYIPSDPEERKGDSTLWFSSYWDFCARFLTKKYGNSWCISPEKSLMIHAGNWAVPTQLIVRAQKASNTITPLPHNTSLFNLKADLPPKEIVTVDKEIRMYSLQGALIYSSPSIFNSNPIDVRTALSMIRDSSELLSLLLEHGHTWIAGRLAGAFRNLGRDKIADGIIAAMKAAGYEVRETDPFEYKLDIDLSPRERSAHVNRTKLLWREMRTVIIKKFPKAPGIRRGKAKYLKSVDDLFITDAYHSLSIERYRVTPELIQWVSSGKWDKNTNEEDKRQRDAMAARGYWQAFQKVKETISAILNGGQPGKLADQDHPKWYRDLFDPSVSAGILKASDLAGYRNSQVYIGGSKHTPLSVEAMRDTMPVLFELLEEEPEASVRAVLGHFVFVFIHPYMDGNGRMGRFLMNVMLASGGYPWTVIPVEKRTDYMSALEKASAEMDIAPFANFIADLVNLGMEGKPAATLKNIVE